MTTEIFKRADGTYLNVEFIPGKEASKPGIVYLHGLLSSMKSRKGEFLKQFALSHGLSYLCFDFTAHGDSWGKPTDWRISQCLTDAVDVLNQYVSVPQVIVGSSMGGWIGLLLSQHHPDKVAAYVGVAAGPDFTQFIWDKVLDENVKAYLKAGNVIGPSEETSEYCFTYAMFEDAQKHFVLNKKIAYTGPVRLLNGDADKLVPYQTAFKIKDVLTSEDVQIILIKGGDHSLSTSPQLNVLSCTLEGVLKNESTGINQSQSK